MALVVLAWVTALPNGADTGLDIPEGRLDVSVVLLPRETYNNVPRRSSSYERSERCKDEGDGRDAHFVWEWTDAEMSLINPTRGTFIGC